MSSNASLDNTLIIDRKKKEDLPELKGWLVLLDNRGKPGKSFELNKSELKIGRSEDNDVVLADTTVSRLHCTIRIENNRILITEEDALNGIYLNDYPRATAALKDGMKIRLGKMKMVVKLI